jgi:phosphoglycerate dehydrogenase-like enzyme
VGEQLVTRKVLITPKGMSIIENKFNEFFGNDYEIQFTDGMIEDKDTLIDLLKDKDACIIGSEKLDDNILKNCKNLKIISRFGSGYDSIDLKYIYENNIKLAIVENQSTEAVARHALALLLAMTNNLIDQKMSSLEGKWIKSFNLSNNSNTIGIIGLGPIARIFISYLLNLGFRVNYYSRSRDKILENQGVKFYKSIKELIKASSIISLHLKLVNETIGIISEEIIKLLEGKYFINTARGRLVDEQALYNALKSKKIIKAGLDVYHTEPATGLSKNLQNLPNVIGTCHTGAYDESSILNVAENAIKNVTNFFSDNYEKVNFVNETN